MKSYKIELSAQCTEKYERLLFLELKELKEGLSTEEKKELDMLDREIEESVISNYS